MALALAFSASACVSNAPQDALKPKGTESRALNHRLNPVFWVAGVVFVLVQGLVLYAAIRFRRRSDDEAPKQIHGSLALELGWGIVPALILAVVGVFTVAKVFEVSHIPKGPDVVHVDVIGHRWWWEYQYKDPADETKVLFATANELHIPIGRKVALDLTSADVIHNYWAPALNGKIYAIPGRHNHLTLEADKPDTYFGQCAEYCGLSHANMRLRVVSHTTPDYDAWVKSQMAAPVTPEAPSDTTAKGSLAYQGYQLFLSTGCAGCHAVQGVSAGQRGPNLTHLESRQVFAGAILAMNDGNLRKWLRNPPAEKPMEPQDGSGMPNLKLTEDQITQLVAYLDTLK